MNVALLYPLALLGALAIAAPLWLHLRRKTDPNVVKFSALRFLEDLPQPQRSPLRLRDLALLALRVLAVLAIVAGFAWPYTRQDQPLVVRESRVYVLDNTLSHQANDGFDHARERLRRELNEAGGDVQVAVVELTSAPRVAVSFGDDRATARRRVDELAPSFQRGSYLAAFRQAAALLDQSLGDRKRLVFLSDHQENQWREAAESPPFLRQVEISVDPPPAPALPNVSLAEPRLQRIFLGDKSLVTFAVRLTHQGGAREATIVVRANDQVVIHRPIALERQPEVLMLQAEWEADPAVWQRGEAVLEAAPDRLAADNRVCFALPPVREGKVALLARSTFLRLALSPEVMRGHWAMRLVEPARLAEELTAETADALCLESSYLQSADARKLVWRYLTNGRGVLLVVDRLTPAVTGALRELGFEARDGEPARANRRREAIAYAAFNHPIFHPFLSPDYGSLQEVKVFDHSRLQAMQGTPLLFAESGDGLFFQGTKFPGRLFVAAFAFDRAQTTWPVHPTFLPFLDLTLQSCRAEDANPTSFEPGELAVIDLPSDAPGGAVVLSAGGREVARAAVVERKARVRLPDEPGLYELTVQNAAEPARVLAVNPSPKESQLTYANAVGTVKQWQMETATPSSPTAAALRPALPLSAILRQRWWWWLLLAGGGALLIETVWSFARREAT